MRPETEAKLLDCRNLPSAPWVALRVIELAGDPKAGVAEAAAAIGGDAALSARILRIANSPLYARRRPVGNLSQALTVLGLNATLTLALGFSLVPGTGTRPATHERVWRRSVIAALASRLLGRAAGLPQLEEVMLGGLLQDIGMLALLQVFGDEYAARIAGAPDHAGLLAVEREWLGCDHAEVGAWLARRWGLPPLLCDAIGRSESPASESVFDACVAVSACVADLWLAGPDGTSGAHQRVALQAATRLGIGSAEFMALLGEMVQLLPEICAAFEVPAVPAARVRSLLDEARELLVVRNLREIRDAARARREAETYQRRARELAEEIRRDPLTGVYNRNQLEEVLEAEFARAVRLGQPLSIAFIDLDDFKRVNDRHGHLVGDEVLRNFAHALSRHVRSTDIVARYGGEEFLVVLPGTGAETAATVVRRVLREVSRIAMAEAGGESLHVTFSAGLATQGSVESFESVGDLLRAADEALYGAKREGRNRVAAGNTGE